MTQTEALKLALEALENNKQTHYYCEDTWYSCPQHENGCANDFAGDECNCGADKANAEIEKAITAIKEALAQPEQEPWPEEPEGHIAGGVHPPQRTWQGLTDEEIMDMYNEPRSDAEMIAFGREVEAKLKEKNT